MNDRKEIPPKDQGHKISVCVESVFEEGMVVCYNDHQTGREYRGALLSLTPVPADQRLLLQPVRHRELANPLTYVHDHPYSNLTKYAKYISKIPSDVVLNWSSFPSSSSLSKANNLKAIESRRKLFQTDRPDDNQLTMPQIRRSTVLVNPVKEREFPYRDRKHIPQVSGRAAKIHANSRIFGVYDSFSHYNKKRRRSRSPRYKKKKQSNRRQKPTPVPIEPKNKPQVSASPTNHTDNSDSPAPRQKIRLKNFSVPLVRINKLNFICISSSSSTSVSPSPPPESISSSDSNDFSSASSASSTPSVPYIIVVD